MSAKYDSVSGAWFDLPKGWIEHDGDFVHKSQRVRVIVTGASGRWACEYCRKGGPWRGLRKLGGRRMSYFGTALAAMKFADEQMERRNGK